MSLGARGWLLVVGTLLVGCSRGEKAPSPSGKTDTLGEAQAAVTPACRSVGLQASRSTHPTTFSDGAATEAPAFGFQIPTSLPVTAGASWHGNATLSFSLGSGALVTCTYHGNAKNSGRGANDCGGTAYDFVDCSNGAHAGDVATADHYTLHIDSSCEKAATTTVALTLNEAQPCGGGFDCSAPGVVIDDGNPCTADACDSVNGVTHTPLVAGTACSDGNACNGLETCDANAHCQAGTPPVLTNTACSTQTCDPVHGVITTNKTAGTSCSDGNACNGPSLVPTRTC